MHTKSPFVKESMISLEVKNSQKISKYLSLESGISYSVTMRLLRKKDIKVNGKRVGQDIALNVGDRIDVYYVLQEKVTYEGIFKDENILVVKKQSGYTSDEVYQNILKEFPTAKYVHRLDRNTDGVMVFALNETAETELLSGFKKHDFIKYYTARVVGKLPKKSEILSAYLVKDSSNSQVKIVSKPIKNSVAIKTGYEVLSCDGETSLLKVRLYTGKTHQIRAHLAYIGHPIVGDGKYGDNLVNKKFGTKRQMLTASEITLVFGKESPLHYLNNKTFKVEK